MRRRLPGPGAAGLLALVPPATAAADGPAIDPGRTVRIPMTAASVVAMVAGPSRSCGGLVRTGSVLSAIKVDDIQGSRIPSRHEEDRVDPSVYGEVARRG